MASLHRACTLALIVTLTGGASLSVLAGVAQAESLKQALIAAYSNNPRVNAERARLRATDEELAIAQSGYRPIIEGSASIARTMTDVRPSTATEGSATPKVVALALQQPIFDGYRTVNAVRAADASILAAREGLRDVEQVVLLEAVTAYTNVLRDQAIVKLRENNVTVLTRDLRATEDRFAVGEVTKTDVAQARARRARSVSDLDLAKANLRSSIADYERVVGHAPSQLHDVKPIGSLIPGNLEEAVAVGMAEHPQVVQAAFSEKAAGHSVDRIEGELLPQITLDARYTDTIEPNRFVDQSESASVTATMVVPLYTGGDVAARARQAKQQQQGAREDIEQARTEIRAQVITSWSQLQAARAQLESDNIQVSSSQIALEGVREEEKVGQRTLLDVLDAEQELLDAKVNLVRTKRDIAVASYTLLAAVGRLSVTSLGLGVDPYDVESHYDDTNGKWWGVTVEYEEGYTGYSVTTGQ